MKPRILNSIGLFLGIVGVVIIFRWGPPQPTFIPGMFIDFGGSQEHDKLLLAERDTYKTRAAVGLGLIGIGFLFQFVAVWVPAGVQAPAHKRD